MGYTTQSLYHTDMLVNGQELVYCDQKHRGGHILGSDLVRCRLNPQPVLNPGFPGAQQAAQRGHQQLQMLPPPNPFLAARHLARGSGTLDHHAQPVISQVSFKPSARLLA